MEDQETLVLMGEAAEALLDSEAFTTTINQLVDSSFQTFATTAPVESEKREAATTITGPLLTSSQRYDSAFQLKTKSSARVPMTAINKEVNEDHERRPATLTQ